MENSFKQDQLKLVCLSDNVRYFAFEGPVFKEKTEKKNKKDKEAANEEKKPALGGGLLDGVLKAKGESAAL